MTQLMYGSLIRAERNTMNQTQSKYAQNRLIRLNNDKAKQITEKYTVKAITLSAEEKIIAIKNNKFTLKDSNGWHDNQLDNRLKFQDEKSSYISDAGIKALKDLTTAYNKAMDELVLGDEVVALALLRSFESTEF